MAINTRRMFFGKIAAIAALITGAPKLFSTSCSAAGCSCRCIHACRRTSGRTWRRYASSFRRRQPHTQWHLLFSGTGSNDGYPKEDHVLVTDPFEKHVTRTMDALKKSVERAGCTMDSIIHLQVFLCLPLADGIAMPTGKARFDAHKAQYDALNKIYGTYFSPAKLRPAPAWLSNGSPAIR